MKKIKIGGVPEHFNLPWHLCMEDGSFQDHGLDISWTDFPDGTGAMCRALRKKELDLAVILTEGIIRDILNGNQAVILQEYIATPLIWGVHVADGSSFKKAEDLRNEKVAISRYGSGSHLMSYINAKNMGWNPEDLVFEEVGNIEGAVEALEKGKAGYFLWESFTTKPLVDEGTFRRIGDCPTPWPCFVIAGRKEFVEQEPGSILTLLKTLNSLSSDFKNIPGIKIALSKKYGQKLEDIEQWLKITSWSQKQVSVGEIDKVQDQLFELSLIPQKKKPLHFLSNL